MMRFRKRRLARINIAVTNRITALFVRAGANATTAVDMGLGQKEIERQFNVTEIADQ
jgi:hypothetical protein